MRLKHPQPFLCLCFFIQVTLAQPKYDYLKNGQRTNPKKYYPTNWATSITSGPIIDNKYSAIGTGVKLRHAPKYPHFEQIKSRIANLDKNSDFSATNSVSGGKSRNSDNRQINSDFGWGSNDFGTRLRHHGWSNRAKTTTSTTTTTTTTPSPEDNLFYNYGELEGDEERRDDYDIFDEDLPVNDEYDSFQAEEPTTSTEKSIPESTQFQSRLSQEKWIKYGTRQAVDKNRDIFLKQNTFVTNKSQEEINTQFVIEHYTRMKISGKCKKPIPKVIPVDDEHPDPSVTYTPHCTVLHRCAEDTGCCRDGSTCQYKERVEIRLYFYVTKIGSSHPKPENRTFFNHTECECREKYRKSPTDPLNTTERQKRVADNPNRKLSFRINTGMDLRSSMSTESIVPETLLMKCKCPKEFMPKIKYNTKCYCDCDNSNEDCIRMKKGKEYFSLADRQCISNKECGTVTCEYGSYNKKIGRCPRYEDS